MLKILLFMKKNLVQSILVGMILGLVVGRFFDTGFIRDYVSLLTFMMVYPMMVTLDYATLFGKGNLKLQVTTQLINFIYLPLLAFLFGLIFFPEALYLRLALLLIALLPTSGMTVSWTVMARGNVKEAIRMIVLGLLLGGLLTPIYIEFFLGASVGVPFRDIFMQIGFIIFLPMLLGFMTQKLLKKHYGEVRFHEEIKPVFPLLSTFFVILLITFVMSLRATMLLDNPIMFVQIFLPLVLGYGLMIVSVHFIGRWLFTYPDRIALVNGTVVRSLSLALAIALNVFGEIGPEIALVIGVAYILQVQFAAWYVKRSIRYHDKHMTT